MTPTAPILLEAAEAASAFNLEALPTGICLLLFAVFFVVFLRRAGRGGTLWLRRLAGIDAIEEAIGRATEMGQPVLYVPGIEDHTDVQTLASLTMLSEVGKRTAEYGTRIIVPTRHPVVLALAEEVVQEAHAAVGRPDTYRADDIRYLSDEQFAFCAAVDGIVLRERPAANIFQGAFFAESLVLAETGFASGAIQVAGTANVHQLPFFIAACDYTLIGEEFYAASAYMNPDPRPRVSIKAGDYLKAVLLIVLLLGIALATWGRVEGDRVTLRSGEEIRGALLEENSESVLIRTREGERWVERLVGRSEVETVREARGTRAVELLQRPHDIFRDGED